jgi:hypothetical protein
MPDQPASTETHQEPGDAKTSAAAPEAHQLAGTSDQPAVTATAEGAASGPGPTVKFKRYYTPHERERERIRRALAEPYRLTEDDSLPERAPTAEKKKQVKSRP